MDETLDPRALRDALGRFVTGVAVMTARGGDGAPVGVTANSFASISLDPPLVLWGLSARSSSLAAFRDGPGFAVNVLADDQRHLASRFAAKVEDRFAGVDWRPGRIGMPILAGCLAHLECSTAQAIPLGDHLVLVGRVAAFDRRAGRPIAFFGSRYATLAAEAAE